jgi:hypothetical protein
MCSLGKSAQGRDARHNRINSVPLQHGLRAVKPFYSKLKVLPARYEFLRLTALIIWSDFKIPLTDNAFEIIDMHELERERVASYQQPKWKSTPA